MRFLDSVLSCVKKIPRGRVTTYGEIARALGDVRASRAVGAMLPLNPRLVKTPCHRVIMSSGELGGYAGGPAAKKKILEKEGVRFSGKKVRDFSKILFKAEEFKADPVLASLRKRQEEWKKKIVQEDAFSGEEVRSVCGIDVGYSKKDSDRAWGAAVVMDLKTGKVLEEKVVEARTEFPYIPTYLVFRELPVIEKLVKSLKSRPDVLMIDGNGVLHPRGAGIASCAGVALGIPSVGVAKTLLCGDVRRDRIFVRGRVAGLAVWKSAEKSSRPVYVSSGHKISLDTAAGITRSCLAGHRIPEPTRLAHLLAKKARGLN